MIGPTMVGTTCGPTHSRQESDVQRLDDLQLEESIAFDKVTEYRGYGKRPKKHFLTHLANDVWRHGPPRAFWCFGFEARNKLLKQLAQASNFKNEAMSMMRSYSMRQAIKLVSCRRALYRKMCSAGDQSNMLGATSLT